jgi:hypothetical protein
MFRPAIVVCVAAMIAVCLASCVGPATAPRATADAPQAKLLEVAQAFLQENHPDWLKETYDLPCRITDQGAFWEVDFELPPPTEAGGPAIYIAKADMAILAAFHEQ